MLRVDAKTSGEARPSRRQEGQGQCEGASSPASRGRWRKSTAETRGGGSAVDDTFLRAVVSPYQSEGSEGLRSIKIFLETLSHSLELSKARPQTPAVLQCRSATELSPGGSAALSSFLSTVSAHAAWPSSALWTAASGKTEPPTSVPCNVSHPRHRGKETNVSMERVRRRGAHA